MSTLDPNKTPTCLACLRIKDRSKPWHVGVTHEVTTHWWTQTWTPNPFFCNHSQQIWRRLLEVATDQVAIKKAIKAHLIHTKAVTTERLSSNKIMRRSRLTSYWPRHFVFHRNKVAHWFQKSVTPFKIRSQDWKVFLWSSLLASMVPLAWIVFTAPNNDPTCCW